VVVEVLLLQVLPLEFQAVFQVDLELHQQVVVEVVLKVEQEMV
tara:strand:+ start:34 stop:162 length:129 start_codon:yes stop_codon:yes gene_type:complete